MLVTVLGDQSMANVDNPRLAKIKEKTLWWQFKILQTPGKTQLAADALSRRSKLPAPLYKLSVTDNNNDDGEDILADMKARIDDIEAGVHGVMRTEEIKVIPWDRLYEAAKEEPLMVTLMEVVLQGFPQSSYDIDEDLRPYHKYRHELHIAGGVVCYKDRAVIPTRLRQKVLETIDAARG